MKLLTNGALLCYGLSLVGHVSKAAIGSFYMVLPAFNHCDIIISIGTVISGNAKVKLLNLLGCFIQMFTGILC